MTSNQTNSQKVDASKNLEADISQSSFLSQELSEAESDANLADLLREMDAADGVARDVETKLDDMLENLDQLLASLEPVTMDREKTFDAKRIDESTWCVTPVLHPKYLSLNLILDYPR